MTKKKIADGVKKYYIITFGCQANLADSERIAGALENAGLQNAAKREAADILVLNTCSIRQKAEDRVFGLKKEIDKIKAKNRKLKTVLTGCMMHYDKKELARRIPFIDFFIDIKEIAKLPKLLGLASGARYRAQDDYLNLAPKYTSKISAGVPISYGCDNFCTYCIVPHSRNREYSRPVEDIVKEVRNLVEKGYKEIWLLGQNVNSYRHEIDCDYLKKLASALETNYKKDSLNTDREEASPASSLPYLTGQYREKDSFEIKFPELLRIINAIPGDFWIRFTSPHPKDFSNELIKAMAECEKFAHYINLPAQSGDNTILKKMNRPYTAGHYKKLAAKIRKAMPDITLSTDIIVGFPGETKKQFENTAKLMREIGFDMAFLSEYSSRPGTAAAQVMKDDVSHAEKECRKKILNDILTKSALKNNKKLIGKTVEVLGNRTRENKLIQISGKPASKTDFTAVKITEAGPWWLKGEVVVPEKMIVILGPTASGKSELAVKIAKKFNGEIISADSRQVYKGMDIGTGKITKKEMKGVPHHLLDVVGPKKIFTVIDFKKKAEKAIKDIRACGKLPIICGGSGFYIQAITGGIAIPEVEPNWELRRKLEKKDTEQLFKMLKKLDSERAENIDPKNPRRLIRAIEVAQAKKETCFHDSRTDCGNINTSKNGGARSESKFLLEIGVKLPEKEVKKGIEKRMKKMLKAGLIEETEKLKKSSLSWKRIGEMGFEYKYPAMYLQGGIDKTELLERLIQSNIKYAKRQMTWFKKYAPKTKWVKNCTEAEKLVKKFI